MYSKVKRKSAIISKEKALTAHNQILDHNIADTYHNIAAAGYDFKYLYTKILEYLH